MASAILKRGRDRRVRLGHLWIYESEIDRVEGNPPPGGILRIRDYQRRYLGTGYINPLSKIRVRLLSRERGVKIDHQFLRSRIQEAIAHRERFYPGAEACRLVYAEGDFLPGLVVDRYGPILAIQISTAGMEPFRELITEILQELLNPAGIYEKSESSSRRHEGLQPRTGLIRGKLEGRISVQLDGIQFLVDMEKDQKTGLYLDHRENRRSLQPFAGEAEVLDLFCNAGSFGLYAAKFGARHVLGVDSSSECLERARLNAETNDFSGRMEWLEGNAFDHLRNFDQQGRKFDVVILDPPSFTKSSDSVEGAVRGYNEINLRAFKIVKPGGFVITSSCSYHIPLPIFLGILRDAAADAHRAPRILSIAGQAPDHPVNLGVPETSYLKCVFLQVP